MSPTHDYILSNQSGASFRSDLNNALAAIVSNNSNSSSPATTYAYQWWADTNTGILKIRNSANNAWIELLQLDGTITLENGSNSAPALAFRDQLTTGIFRTSNSLGISSEGTTRALFDSSGVTVTNKAIITSTADAAIDLDCGTGSAGGNQKSFIDFKINGTVKANIAVNEANSGNPLELASAGNGAVHAFFDNNLKFSTESFGVRFHGTLHGQNNNGINLGNDNDLQIKVTDTNSTITHNGEGNLFISAEGSEEDLYLSAADDIFLRVQGSEDGIKILGDNQVELAFNGTKQFETTSVGCQLKGQTRFATSGGTFCGLTEVFKNTSHSAGSSLSFQTVNGHGGGTVTVTLTVNGNAAVKTTKMFGMALRSTSNSGLTSEIFSINSGTGVNFSVTGSSQGVTVTNNSSSACTCTVRFDMSGAL
mgnify:CR=1 FL=1|tara:strand:- start:1180 stop:2448 length:1269 start_codon:yes stop_codon:yes gene_type:complete